MRILRGVHGAGCPAGCAHPSAVPEPCGHHHIGHPPSARVPVLPHAVDDRHKQRQPSHAKTPPRDVSAVHTSASHRNVPDVASRTIAWRNRIHVRADCTMRVRRTRASARRSGSRPTLVHYAPGRPGRPTDTRNWAFQHGPRDLGRRRRRNCAWCRPSSTRLAAQLTLPGRAWSAEHATLEVDGPTL